MNAPIWLKNSKGSLALAGLIFFAIVGRQGRLPAVFPPCPPPAANEYLLLVRGDSQAERDRIQALLPSSSTVMICNYLDDTVVRGGGFTDLETANAWAQYMTEVEQLQAFVARPAITPPGETPAAEPPVEASEPAPEETTAAPETAIAAPTEDENVPATAFNPVSLGSGYAVLVNYQDQPEVALAVQEQVGQAIGLAVYRQRPYLLIAHSSGIEGAASTLRVLTNRNIAGFIVDSQQVVMLTPAIATAF